MVVSSNFIKFAFITVGLSALSFFVVAFAVKPNLLWNKKKIKYKLVLIEENGLTDETITDTWQQKFKCKLKDGANTTEQQTCSILKLSESDSTSGWIDIDQLKSKNFKQSIPYKNFLDDRNELIALKVDSALFKSINNDSTKVIDLVDPSDNQNIFWSLKPSIFIDSNKKLTGIFKHLLVTPSELMTETVHQSLIEEQAITAKTEPNTTEPKPKLTKPTLPFSTTDKRFKCVFFGQEGTDEDCTFYNFDETQTTSDSSQKVSFSSLKLNKSTRPSKQIEMNKHYLTEFNGFKQLTNFTKQEVVVPLKASIYDANSTSNETDYSKLTFLSLWGVVFHPDESVKLALVLR